MLGRFDSLPNWCCLCQRFYGPVDSKLAVPSVDFSSVDFSPRLIS